MKLIEKQTFDVATSGRFRLVERKKMRKFNNGMNGKKKMINCGYGKLSQLDVKMTFLPRLPLPAATLPPNVSSDMLNINKDFDKYRGKTSKRDFSEKKY